MNDMTSLAQQNLLAMSETLIRQRSPSGFAFWLGGETAIDPSAIRLQDHADIVYSLHLLGAADRLSPVAATRFGAMLAGAQLHGRPVGVAIAEKRPNAHLTAYALGAVRLLDKAGLAPMPAQLYHGWDLAQLIDGNDLPIWPRAWTHHIWRVSHWIGGVPSILLQLADAPVDTGVDRAMVARVLTACEARIIDQATGLLRPYRSRLLQAAFRAAYRLRHDPDIGDVGGVVHLLWVHHASGRDYVAPAALHRAATRHLRAAPFIETMPYCLDFDIVQLARTTQAEVGAGAQALADRAERFATDIAAFLSAPIPAAYTLHKLPGALATLHECAFICDAPQTTAIGTAPIDIIKDAYWI